MLLHFVLLLIVVFFVFLMIYIYFIAWGKAVFKPDWWPDDISWENIVRDTRADKDGETWASCLRHCIRACLLAHGYQEGNVLTCV